MDDLAGLSEEARRLAMERFRLLQPHIENNEPESAHRRDRAGPPQVVAGKVGVFRDGESQEASKVEVLGCIITWKAKED